MVEKSRLKSLGFFAGMKPAGLEALSRCAEDLEFPDGSVLLREGKRADGFHVIAEGNAVVQLDLDGDTREIQTLAPGDVIGWSSITTFKRWRFDVIASGPLKTLWFEAEGVEAALASHPHQHVEVMKRIVAAMSERIEFLEELLLHPPGRALG